MQAFGGSRRPGLDGEALIYFYASVFQRSLYCVKAIKEAISICLSHSHLTVELLPCLTVCLAGKTLLIYKRVKTDR